MFCGDQHNLEFRARNMVQRYYIELVFIVLCERKSFLTFTVNEFERNKNETYYIASEFNQIVLSTLERAPKLRKYESFQ